MSPEGSATRGNPAAVPGDVVDAGVVVAPVVGVRRAAACQIRAASRIIATANGSMNSTTLGPMAPMDSATSRPAVNKTASQRRTARLRHSAELGADHLVDGGPWDGGHIAPAARSAR